MIGERSPTWVTFRAGERRRQAAGVVLVMFLAMLARPPAALAHITTGALSTTYRATVGGFRPAAPGLRAKVLGGDLRLALTVPARDRVTVLGLVGEPFLRFGPGGVWANGRSPTAATAGVVKPGAAHGWVRLSSGHTYTWHENRLRPLSAAPPGGGTRRIATWRVPLIVNGRRTLLSGAEWWGPRPAWWPWIAAGAAAVAAAAAAARFAGQRALHAASLLLLPPVVGALGVGWAGIFLNGNVTPLGLALSAVALAVSAVFAALAVGAAHGPAQVCVAGLVGAVAATFAIPQISVFAHAFVLSALPAPAARLAVWMALAGGSAGAILCIPSAVELLDRSPYESLRPDRP